MVGRLSPVTSLLRAPTVLIKSRGCTLHSWQWATVIFLFSFEADCISCISCIYYSYCISWGNFPPFLDLVTHSLPTYGSLFWFQGLFDYWLHSIFRVKCKTSLFSFPYFWCKDVTTISVSARAHIFQNTIQLLPISPEKKQLMFKFYSQEMSFSLVTKPLWSVDKDEINQIWF